MSEQALSIDEAYSQALKILGDKDTKQTELGQAIELLQKISAAGYTSAQLEGNLGRAFARLENWPQAVLHFQKAVSLDRWNSELRDDLSFAQEKIEGGQGRPLSHPSEWGYRIASHVRPKELFAGALFLTWLFLMWAFVKKGLPRKIWIPSSVVLAALFALAGFSSTGSSLATVASSEAAPLRSAPLENSEEKTALRPGTRVRVIRTSGSFTEVEGPDAGRGWVSSSSLQAVPL
jgi:tetratricopeptide (TPR) repeat protein